MKFKKKAFLPLAAGCVLALTSCDGSSTETIFWSNLYTTSETTFFDALVDEFNETSSKTFVYEQSGTYDAIYSALTNAIATPANLPTMAVVYPDYVYNWIDEGVVLDITTLVEDDEVGLTDAELADYVTDYYDEGHFYSDDTLYTLPFSKTAEALYYNETYLVENGYLESGHTPSTWTEIVQDAYAILAADAASENPIYTDDNLGITAPIGVYSTSNLFITMSEMLDIPYASNEDTNGDDTLSKSEAVLFNNDQAKEMVKMLKTWYDDHVFTTYEVMYAIQSSGYIEDPFYNGEMYYCIDSTKGYSYFNGSYTDDEGNTTNYFNDTKVTLVPSIDSTILNSADYSNPTGGTSADKTIVMSQGGSIVFFDKGDEDTKNAFEFYKLLSDPENNGEFAVAVGCAPFVESAYESDAITSITANDTIDFTTDPTLEERNNYLLANIYNVFEEYAEQECYYTAPVNQFSSAQRDAVESLLVNVLTTDLDSSNLTLDELIEQEFTRAYEVI